MGKRKTASAIGYTPEDIGPRLLAAGKGERAERIISIAEAAGVAVLEDPALAALLDAGAEVGDIIPAWCWEAAATVLAFVLVKDAGCIKSK
jgi:flagellar biosynthesis protein